MNNKWLKWLFLFLVVLGNYQFAKLTQRFWLGMYPDFSYLWAIVIPWIGLGLLLCSFDLAGCGLKWDGLKSIVNWRQLAWILGLLTIGIVLFILLGVTKYFHTVKSPVIFYLFTPIAEELIFRGWVYRQMEKWWKWPVVTSALFFGLHHLQYFGYHLTNFAIFQIAYTFVLGLFLGKMRKDSGSIYLPLLAHILLNWATLQW
jgi:membrane protease YdiL (CAAX protease family)